MCNLRRDLCELGPTAFPPGDELPWVSFPHHPAVSEQPSALSMAACGSQEVQRIKNSVGHPLTRVIVVY